jgi:hypothetical protein
MNNAKVIALPASTSFTPEQALLSMLEFARNDNLSDCLLVGYDAAGELLVRSSRITRADAIFLLEKAKEWSMA